MENNSNKEVKLSNADSRLSPSHKMPEAFKIKSQGKIMSKGVSKKAVG